MLLVQQRHFFWDDVNGHHFVVLSQEHGVRKADVAGSGDGDFHGLSGLEQPPDVEESMLAPTGVIAITAVMAVMGDATRLKLAAASERQDPVDQLPGLGLADRHARIWCAG